MAKELTHDWDVVVIGGGPGGYTAAIRAAQLGFRSACVEKEALGGICLNWGCIPTKALLKNAETIRMLIEHGDDLGLSFDNLRFDIGKIIGRSRGVAQKLSGGVASLFRKYKVTHIVGTATLKGGGKLAVAEPTATGAKELSARHIIVATGARPRALPFAPFDGESIISYREAMVPQSLPKSLAIIGAGAIGVEFAYFYRSFGVEVTILERFPRLVPVEDDEISALLRRSFETSGIKVITGAQVEGVTKTDGGVSIQTKDAKGETTTIAAERLLVAVGVMGNVENIGLEAAGVATDKGRIPVDASYRTNVPGVYAIGDVIGAPWLAHVAAAEGICCVERIAGLDRPDIDYTAIPGNTYCQPEIASVGKTERELKEQNVAYRVGRFPYRANGKALAALEETGMVKVLFGEKHGELLGAHIVGHGATEMIHTLVLAKTWEAGATDILHTVFAHPTLSEGIHEATGDAFGEAINI
ncbi:MAG: dihydrolipoyl dehydrogenase [Myxococcales bacterium]|nr:dihydrolipoyl dehydrogenase [Myxococcales bacterium]